MANDSAPPGRAQPPAEYLDGAKLAEVRKARKLTQEKLAVTVDVTQGQVSRWEDGTNSPGIETVADLALALDCEMHELMHAGGIEAFTALAQAIQRAPGAATAA